MPPPKNDTVYISLESRDVHGTFHCGVFVTTSAPGGHYYRPTLILGNSTKAVEALGDEATIMDLFTNVKTKHIVKLYRDITVEPADGQIDLTTKPRKGDYIARIFMESCRGGDMAEYRKNPIPEELLWHMFKCLVSGLVAMEYGNELVKGKSWGLQILHNDIKPSNILISNNDNEHLKTPVFKFADFCVSRILPEKQSIQWIQQQFFAKHYPAPEFDQTKLKYDGIPLAVFSPTFTEQPVYDPLLQLDSHTSIRAVAKVLYNLITRTRSFGPTTAEFDFELPGPPSRIIRIKAQRLLRLNIV
ncbi:hypothetical protein VTL71DRAFT_1221 [Oculimacula yallundae]|uniref:non-specific serine/threonine protein kinase n=1 Tax=Oculimacula yallundae TaxID=86028 RepID=A0ABR4CB96_9HELO